MPSRARLNHYPPVQPYRAHRLTVGDGHILHIEECGNPKGQPVVVLHGGPGGGCNPTMRRFHDPQRYRIILFDQRGCGRSTPNASLDHNTTQHLIDDMERIRSFLAIGRWHIFGGSWGSTLGLAYAQQHAAQVMSMVLRGIFLMTKTELQWFYQDGCKRLFPEAFADFERLIPETERGDMIGAYHRRLTSGDQPLQRQAARSWSAWEGSRLSLLPEPERVARFAADSYALAFARIEAHYFVNCGFLEFDGALLQHADKLAGIPGIIVHGRYDVVTPVRAAYRLHRAWPGSELRIVADAGHAMSEPSIVHELISATNRVAGLPLAAIYNAPEPGAA